MLGSRGLGGVQRNLLPLLGLGSVSDYCGAPSETHINVSPRHGASCTPLLVWSLKCDQVRSLHWSVPSSA